MKDNEIKEKVPDLFYLSIYQCTVNILFSFVCFVVVFIVFLFVCLFVLFCLGFYIVVVWLGVLKVGFLFLCVIVTLPTCSLKTYFLLSKDILFLKKNTCRKCQTHTTIFKLRIKLVLGLEKQQ